MTSRNDEDYLPNHARLPDETLLAASGGLTEPIMFVATFEAQLSNISMPMDDAIVMIDPVYPVVAINSNFGHKCVPGYERYLKVKPGKALGTRKGQGDRTCFNSALEPVIVLDRADIPASKVYYMKCFPSTGQVQVPGTLLPSMEDGIDAVNAWVDLLNFSGVADADENSDPLQINVTSSRPNMINFKFRIRRASPRILIDLYCMAEYFITLEDLKVLEGKSLSQKESDAIVNKLPHGSTLIPPPFHVRETKPPIEDVKLTFKFGRIRVKIFQRGKVNILGSDSFESANKIHRYLTQLIQANRSKFIRLQPKSDAECRAKDSGTTSADDTEYMLQPLTKAAQAPPSEPIYDLSDSEFDAIINGMDELDVETTKDEKSGGAYDAVAAAMRELETFCEEFDDPDEITEPNLDDSDQLEDD
jgi:hypothetical protein